MGALTTCWCSYDINVTPDKRKTFLHHEDELLSALQEVPFAADRPACCPGRHPSAHSLQGPLQALQELWEPSRSTFAISNVVRSSQQQLITHSMRPTHMQVHFTWWHEHNTCASPAVLVLELTPLACRRTWMLLAMKLGKGWGLCCQMLRTCTRLRRQRRALLLGAQAGSMLCCSIMSSTGALALTKTTTGCRDAHAGPGAQKDEARDPQDAGSLDTQGWLSFASVGGC